MFRQIFLLISTIYPKSQIKIAKIELNRQNQFFKLLTLQAQRKKKIKQKIKIIRQDRQKQKQSFNKQSMQLNFLQKNQQGQGQEEYSEFSHHLSIKQISQVSPNQILKLLLQKDQIIQSFSQQITKYKANQLKSKKLISSLQEKIEKSLPSANNTSKQFMMPSEFKNLFTNFMTSTVPAVLYDFVDFPILYRSLVRKLFEAVYNILKSSLIAKLKEISQILIGNSTAQQNATVKQKADYQQLKYHLLQYFQKNYKSIFPLNFSKKIKFIPKENQQQIYEHSFNSPLLEIFSKISISEQIVQKFEQLIALQKDSQTQFSQPKSELKQFCQELYEICAYMILQENQWEFVFDEISSKENESQNQNNFSIQKYKKKQFTCIDGFVKQQSQVIYVLKGLRKKDNQLKRQFHYHPNIKNFVLPYTDAQEKAFNYQNIYVKINFSPSQNKKNIMICQHLQISSPATIQVAHNNCKEKALIGNQKEILKEIVLNSEHISQTQVQSLVLAKQISKSTINLSQNSYNYKNFNIGSIRQTQKSEIVDSLVVDNFQTHLKNQNLTKASKKKNDLCTFIQQSKQNSNKENLNFNIGNLNENSEIKPLVQLSKKQRGLLEKNLMKKAKKEKISSTIDLVGQKRKISQKNQCQQAVLGVNKKNNDQLPLNRDIGKSKKKNPGKSSRKCSVGKIISQSIQMGTAKHQTKQKQGISQHSTIVMKQSIICKPNRQKQGQSQNYTEAIVIDSKQYMGNFIGHMYQKTIIRPKKSSQLLQKKQEKHLNLSIKQKQIKQQRPLALRMYQNNCLVGKLRDKYLIG